MVCRATKSDLDRLTPVLANEEIPVLDFFRPPTLHSPKVNPAGTRVAALIALVKATHPWIEPERMQPMRMFKYKTEDGRSLDAYVALPAGASKANPAPLVVLPYGAPSVRDSWGFDR